MASVTITMNKKQYYLLYNITAFERQSLSQIARNALYRMAGEEPPPYRRTWSPRLITPLLDDRPEHKPFKAAIYLTEDALKLADRLAKEKGMSRRGVVSMALWDYVYRLAREKYAEELRDFL